MKTIKAIISGRVQRVTYRYSTFFRALAWGIKGYVTNKPDKTVEAVFQSSEENINKILKWCYKGPLLARVDNIKITQIKNSKIYKKFKIIR
jgi:acylphosphatase